ncbi:hypothetical protein AAMO2058_001105900 [Amorphochlora amoebiformis]
MTDRKDASLPRCMGHKSNDRGSESKADKAGTKPRPSYWKNRWVMLLLYGALTISDHIFWVSFWPITSRGKEFFGVSDTLVFMLSMIYIIVFIVFAPIAGQVVDHLGLRYGVLSAALFNFFGCLVKVIPAPFSLGGKSGYVFTFLGHILGGVAHSFILILPATLAQNWFDSKTRVLAQGLCSTLSQIGITTGVFLAPAIGYSKGRIALLLLLQFLGSIAILIIELIFFVGEAPVPPSSSIQRSANPPLPFPQYLSLRRLRNTLFTLLRIPGFFGTSLAFGVAKGAYYAIWVVLSLRDRMYDSESHSANVLLIYLFVGVLGTVVWCSIIDRTVLNHRSVNILIYCGFTVSLLLFCASLLMDNFALVGVSGAFMGFFGSAVSPCSIDLLVENTFPGPLALTSATALVIFQVCSLVFIWVNFEMTAVQKYAPGIFLSIAAAFSVPLLTGSENSHLRRRDYEARTGNVTNPQAAGQAPIHGIAANGAACTHFFIINKEGIAKTEQPEEKESETQTCEVLASRG